MTLPHRKGLDRKQVLSLLAAAEWHIRDDALDAAAADYRLVLGDPITDALPAARTDAQANLGALLLHAMRIDATAPSGPALLEEAIQLLTRARTAYQRGEGAGNGVITDANLALAYFQRHRLLGDDTDLMSAHVALDGAEAAVTDDPATRDWVRSIRDLLVEHAERRNKPR